MHPVRRPTAGRPARPALLIFAAAASIAAFVAGCGSEVKPEAKTADDASSKPKTAAAAKDTAPKLDTKSPTSGSIQIDDKILKACGDIPTAHFAFDSAAIGPEATAALDALARCFVSGPLKDSKGMHLVGHADSRGEVEYNLALGQKRAGSVGEYLITKGLQKSRIQTLSKGAFEATGTDEEGWARDRKVDVTLSE
ncbi:MAG: OmpA family protein [Byssovorax sp.]